RRPAGIGAAHLDPGAHRRLRRRAAPDARGDPGTARGALAPGPEKALRLALVSQQHNDLLGWHRRFAVGGVGVSPPPRPRAATGARPWVGITPRSRRPHCLMHMELRSSVTRY